MHRIIQSYLNQFVAENELSSLEQSEQFEHFLNYCVISQFFPERFDLEAVHTSADDLGIDGVAVLLGCEPTTHRSVLKDSSPLPHRHDEWPWGPPAIASLGVGQSFSNL